MASATGGAWSVGLTADQVLLGEGPAVAALSTGEPAVVADVAASAAEMPVMAERATAAGAAAAFLFPLGTQAATLGLLAAYRRTPGPLSDDEQADARIIAQVATVTSTSRPRRRTGGSSPRRTTGGTRRTSAACASAGRVTRRPTTSARCASRRRPTPV